MTSSSPLRVFSLECDDESRTISPHVRYISPGNVLKELYKIINCDCVTCSEIDVDGKFLLNHYTKQFVDLDEYKKLSTDKHGWTIHPLLTAVGKS